MLRALVFVALTVLVVSGAKSNSRSVYISRYVLLGDDDNGTYVCDDDMSQNDMAHRCDCAKQLSSDSYINYEKFHWCTMADYKALSAIILTIALLFYFYLVGTTTDVFLVPTLERLSNFLKLTPQVAGVTLLALGNGAPDVFTSFASFTGGGTGAIGVGEVTGAALFITTCVLASVTVASDDFQTKRGPFLRDVIFTLASVVLLFIVFADKTVHLWEGLLFFILYFVYILVVGCGKRMSFSHDEEEEEEEDVERAKGGKKEKDKGTELKLTDSKAMSKRDDAADGPPKADALEVPGSKPKTSSKGSGDMLIDYLVVSTAQKRRISTNARTNVALLLRSEEDAHHAVYHGPPDGHTRGGHSRGGGTYDPTLVVSSGAQSRGASRNDQWKRSTAGGASQQQQASRQASRHSQHSKIQSKIMPINEDQDAVQTPLIPVAGSSSAPTSTNPWTDASFLGKCKIILEKIITFAEGPFVIARILTIPMFQSHDLENDVSEDDGADGEGDDEEDLISENKTCLCLALLFGPLMFAFVAGADTYALLLILFLGSAASLFMFRSILSLPQDEHGAIKFVRWQQFFFLAVAFTVSILWVYSFANELVACLSTLGTIMGLSETTLGLTILAIGNSVGDLVADVMIARRGNPLMAIGGVFGGPGFNIMIGLGLGFVYATVSEPFNFDFQPTVPVGFIFCIGGLVCSLVYLPISNYWFKKKFGYVMMIYYIGFVICGLLTEGGVLPAWDVQN